MSFGDPNTGQPLIRVEGLSKRYRDGTLALSSVSLDIAPGAFVSLVGPSGCGKSTLLRLIAGLSGPTSGRIETPDLRAGQDMGVVFQDPTLMPWASIAANVALPFRLGHQPPNQEAEQRVAATIERVGLAGFEGRYPRQLSGGMRMRAALARALVTDPSVLLMDEPFGALDEITRDGLNDDLRAIHAARGVTVVFVTHSVAEAVYLSDDIVVMSPRPGRIFKRVSIPLDKTRTPDMRTSQTYLRTVAEVSSTLRAASREPSAP